MGQSVREGKRGGTYAVEIETITVEKFPPSEGLLLERRA